MPIVRVSKEFTFEMAHALYQHDGKCAGIHGHSYHLTVTISGKPIEVEADPKNGMVIDFKDLSKIVKENIVEVFDHSIVLHERDPLSIQLADGSSRIIKSRYQPTSENLLLDFVQRIRTAITPPRMLHSMKLRETGSSYAEWFQSDNE
jgi:6-pyruvoyltetrahydropterin/6-carboxytetrahydropterin synthase